MSLCYVHTYLNIVGVSFTCSNWVERNSIDYIVTDQNIDISGTHCCHMLPVELWGPSCKTSSLFVDRKYQMELSAGWTQY